VLLEICYHFQQPTTSNNLPLPTTYHFQQPTTSNNLPLPTTYHFERPTTSNDLPLPTTYHFQRPTISNDLPLPTTYLTESGFYGYNLTKNKKDRNKLDTEAGFRFQKLMCSSKQPRPPTFTLRNNHRMICTLL
jgi:hypothetical protein